VKRMFLAVLALTLLSSVSVVGSEPIKIGVTLGLTGKYSEMANMQLKGYRLWEEQLNSRGGMLGRQVEVVVRDDQSEGNRAASLYENMIVKEKVDLVFSPYSSGVTNAILPVTSKHGYPVLAGGASSDRLWQQGYGNIFGVYTPASRYVVGFLEMLVINNLGELAIVSADDAFSLSISEGTRKWADRYGLKVVLFERFNKGTSDFEQISKQVRQSGARVLIVCGHYDEAVKIRESILHTNGPPLAFYASVGPVFDGYHDQLGDKANLVFSSSQWEPNPDLAFPGSRKFIEDFQKVYGLMPSYHAATAFASGTIMEMALNNTGAIDRKKIMEALSSMDVMTLIGRFGVDRTGMQVRQFPVIIQWQNGKKEIIWPEELKTSDPVFDE